MDQACVRDSGYVDENLHCRNTYWMDGWMDGWMDKKRRLHIPSPLHHFLHLIWACCCHVQRAGLIGPNGPPVTHQGLRFAGGTCDVLFPTGNQCSGNSSETRACLPISNFIPGEHRNPRTFTLNTCRISTRWTNKDLSLLTRSTHTKPLIFCSAGIISLSSSALSKWHDRTMHCTECFGSICTHTFDT